MVNGISNSNNAAFYRAAAGTAVLHKNDVETMIKFANGQPITGTAEPTVGEAVKGTIPFLGIFGGFQAGAAIKKHGWSIKDTIADVKATSPYTKRGDAFLAGKDRITKEYGNFFNKSVVVDPKRGVVGRCLDKLPGYSKLRTTGFGQAMGKSGAGWMCVMDGAIETFTQVVPTFQQLGAGAGFKQIATSGTKVVAGAAGWLAGDVVGKGLGAALGTLICPGVGTAIGGFVGGFLGGIIGSSIAGKAAKSITGKNELEKVQEQNIAQQTQQIEADPQTKLALAQQTIQQAEQTLAQDPKNEDALAAKASAENVLTQLQSQQQEYIADAGQQVDTQMPGQMPTQPQYQDATSQMSNQMIPPVPGFNGATYDMNQYSTSVSQASMPTVNPFAQQQQYQTQQAV